MVRFDAQQLHAAGDAAARPFAYSYWLLPGRLLAGAHPTARGSESAARHLQALHGQGITCCVDLTSTRDALPSYQPLHGRRLSFPIADYGLPGVDAMRATLDAIDSAMSAGESVYQIGRAHV